MQLMTNLAKLMTNIPYTVFTQYSSHRRRGSMTLDPLGNMECEIITNPPPPDTQINNPNIVQSMMSGA